ncbi:hypothetical protein [Arthrobacter castelli]|uniref:hypothetical protein n=1 Tax=Arthrobacter castelli TaxID=271431 RepID=UPI0003F80A10|nr:hypothetical protein [Arthrobacter castelli]
MTETKDIINIDEAKAMVEHQAFAIHRLLWDSIKLQQQAVHDVLRVKDLAYKIDNENVPPGLFWAVIGGFGTSRYTLQDDRWIVTEYDRRRKQHGPRQVDIPAEFIGASTGTCRRLARRMITEHQLHMATEAKQTPRLSSSQETQIRQLRQRLDQLQAA